MKEMPEKLKQFLASLSGEDANKVWTYLDSHGPLAIDAMIEVVSPIAQAAGFE